MAMNKDPHQTPVVSLISRGARCTFIDPATQDTGQSHQYDCVEKRYCTDAMREPRECLKQGSTACFHVLQRKTATNVANLRNLRPNIRRKRFDGDEREWIHP